MLHLRLPDPQLSHRDAHSKSPDWLFSAVHDPPSCHWRRRISLKPKQFWWQTAQPSSPFLQSHSSRLEQGIQCFFLTLLCVFLVYYFYSNSPWTNNILHLELIIILKLFFTFFVIQFFCTMRTWGQDIILIRDAFKPLKRSNFVPSFSLKYMRHESIVYTFCSKHHQVFSCMFFALFLFLKSIEVLLQARSGSSIQKLF